MNQQLRVKAEKTIEQNSAMVYRLAYSLVKEKQDAEDIHQEVFIKYLKTRPEFQNPEHEKAWFIKVTVNLCKNLWKTPWKRKMVSMEDIGERGTEYFAKDARTSDGEYSQNTANIDAGEELTDEEEILIETVKRLPIKYKVVIHLFYYEEMSIEEIATSLGLKPSNVRTRLTRARKMLKEWLKEDI